MGRMYAKNRIQFDVRVRMDQMYAKNRIQCAGS